MQNFQGEAPDHDDIPWVKLNKITDMEKFSPEMLYECKICI